MQYKFSIVAPDKAQLKVIGTVKDFRDVCKLLRSSFESSGIIPYPLDDLIICMEKVVKKAEQTFECY